MVPQHILELARDLYACYLAACDGKNYEGKPCPTWEELPSNIVANWVAVANGAHVALVPELAPGEMRIAAKNGVPEFERGDKVTIVKQTLLDELRIAWDAVPDHGQVPAGLGIAQWLQPLINATTALVAPGYVPGTAQNN